MTPLKMYLKIKGLVFYATLIPNGAAMAVFF